MRLSETVPSERTWPLKVRWRRWTRRGPDVVLQSIKRRNDGIEQLQQRGLFSKSGAERRQVRRRAAGECALGLEVSCGTTDLSHLLRKHLLPSRRRVAGFLGEAASSLCRSVLPSQMRAQFPAPAAPGSKAVCRPKMDNFVSFFPPLVLRKS